MKSTAWLEEVDARLEQQLRFLVSVDRLKTVIRGSRIADASRRENTAEHSWHLALFALVLQEHAVGAVDTWRVVQMLLLHDLVEIKCGDTPLFDAAGALVQAERERVAAVVIFGLLPEGQGAALRALWKEFEAPKARMRGLPRRWTVAADPAQPCRRGRDVDGLRRGCGTRAIADAAD